MTDDEALPHRATAPWLTATRVSVLTGLAALALILPGAPLALATPGAAVDPASTATTETTNTSLELAFAVDDITPAAGQLVRFFGTVAPAHNGDVVLIQRRAATGGWKTVAQTVLVAAIPREGVVRSRYSKKLRIQADGFYRVRVFLGDADHTVGTTHTRILPVH